MEPNDLLMFAQVADAGSFTRAAERMKLPKSTVSRRIAALETELGERLLQRSTRKLLITEFGDKVLQHARQVLCEVEQTQALAQHRQVLPSGRLRVSMPADFANTALQQMLADFVRAHPAISLELDLSARRVDLIGENFDLAIRMGDLPEDSLLTAKRLGVFKVGFYASPAFLAEHGAPTTPDDLNRLHALMLMSRTGEALPWRLQPLEASEPGALITNPVSRTLANSPDVLMRLTQNGCGVTTLADFIVEPMINGGQLARVLPGWMAEPAVAWAVFPGRRLMPAKTRVFLDALTLTLDACPASRIDRP
ncbi:MAG: LysR family transcriptional regulator [Burkholderiaceae bacterium]|nr:LysR family transcriptional regulator [Burkholderiaceae bacterium]